MPIHYIVSKRYAQEFNDITPLEAALRYAADGFPVFPVISPAYTLFGKKPGKAAFTGYRRRATTDALIVETWFRRHPAANVGLVIAACNCLALDIDTQRDGFDSLSRLPALPPTRENLTGSGGKHLLFRYPSHMRIRSAKDLLGPGLDIVAEGTYIVVFPSVSHTGRQYGWVDYAAPIADAPAVLLRLIDEASATRNTFARRLVDTLSPPKFDPKAYIKYGLCTLVCELKARTRQAP